MASENKGRLAGKNAIITGGAGYVIPIIRTGHRVGFGLTQIIYIAELASKRRSSLQKKVPMF